MMRAMDRLGAAVLVDAYLQLKRHPAMSRRAVAEDVSCQLRAYAWQQGHELVPVYMDVPEVELLLSQAEWVDTVGAQGVANDSAVLKDMVDLCKYHEEDFARLLAEARQAVPIPAEARAIMARQSVARETPVAVAPDLAEPVQPEGEPLPEIPPVSWEKEELRAKGVQILALCLYLHDGEANAAGLEDLGRLVRQLARASQSEPSAFGSMLTEARAMLGSSVPSVPEDAAPREAGKEQPPVPGPAVMREQLPAAEIRESREQVPAVPGEAGMVPPAVPEPQVTREQVEAVRRYCRGAGRVVTRADIERDLGLGWAVAEAAIGQTEDIVSGGDESCLAVSVFPVTLPQLDEMKAVLQQALAQAPEGEITAAACRKLLAAAFPEQALAAAGLSNEAYYNALAYLLGLDFAFVEHKIKAL